MLGHTQDFALPQIVQDFALPQIAQDLALPQIAQDLALLQFGQEQVAGVMEGPLALRQINHLYLKIGLSMYLRP